MNKKGFSKIAVLIAALAVLIIIGVIYQMSDQEGGIAPDNEVFCAQDVRECPDGSFVSRVPPSCEFAECSVAPEFNQ
jgi:hypothetical protein